MEKSPILYCLQKAIIFELKYNHTGTEAYECIKVRGYTKLLNHIRRVIFIGLGYVDGSISVEYSVRE
jgi:hypothetical protein